MKRADGSARPSREPGTRRGRPEPEAEVVEARIVDNSPLREHLTATRLAASDTGPDREALVLWLAQLDALEESLGQVEAMLGAELLTDVPDWTPSAPNPVAIPPELIPRARMIMERQMAVAHEVTRRLVATKAEIALAQKVQANAPLDVPFYVDTQA